MTLTTDVEAKLKVPAFEFVLNGGAKAELEASFGKQGEDVGIQVTLKPLVFYLIGSIGIKETPVNPEIPLFKVNYIHNITNEIALYPQK